MMKIDSNGAVSIDGQRTGVSVWQHGDKTRVFTRENKILGVAYKEHTMPSVRYNTTTNITNAGVAGVDALEADIRDLLADIG